MNYQTISRVEIEEGVRFTDGVPEDVIIMTAFNRDTTLGKVVIAATVVTLDTLPSQTLLQLVNSGVIKVRARMFMPVELIAAEFTRYVKFDALAFFKGSLTSQTVFKRSGYQIISAGGLKHNPYVILIEMLLFLERSSPL